MIISTCAKIHPLVVNARNSPPGVYVKVAFLYLCETCSDVMVYDVL